VAISSCWRRRVPEPPTIALNVTAGDTADHHEVGPGASRHRGARHLRLAKDLVRTSCLSESESAWPSRFGPAGMFRMMAAQGRLAAAVHLICAVTSSSKVNASCPVASCSSPNVNPRTRCPHRLRVARPHDRTPLPAKSGADNSLTWQVQLLKCCGRPPPESS
jgi:hypothetical protein